jgi:hypothetical protein
MFNLRRSIVLTVATTLLPFSALAMSAPVFDGHTQEQKIAFIQGTSKNMFPSSQDGFD